jgi:hypothetical protein
MNRRHGPNRYSRFKELIAPIQEALAMGIQGASTELFLTTCQNHRLLMQTIDSFNFQFYIPCATNGWERGRGISSSGDPPMTRLHTPKRRRTRNQAVRRVELEKMLDILSAFDRGVVELSMGVYNIPRRDRVEMRRQNRRLHRALRECLPRLLKPSPNLLQLFDARRGPRRASTPAAATNQSARA